MNLMEIKDPLFLKKLNEKELEDLSQEIRQFLIDNISKTGGHFSSNLGIVELTVALHRIFDSPNDKILFDVGHQSYVHKILTGRINEFSSLRKLNGLSGFQKRKESIYDSWEAGHSSTSISGATGMAIARDLKNEKFEVISVIGDAALMSGESFEALNYLGSIDTKVIIVLNDNNMSIGKNVGGLSNVLQDVRISSQYNDAKNSYTEFLMKTDVGKKIFHVTKKVKDIVKNQVLPDTLFKQFGLDYIGPIDGHNMDELMKAMTLAKEMNHSVVIHIHTIKGKGYTFAEMDKKGVYHGVAPFDKTIGIQKQDSFTWSAAVANHIEYLMKNNLDVCAITPAMVSGSALQNIFEKFPSRSFDVGIAEEHAMTFCAGLASSDIFPFISVYSSFVQRCYDQINHDIARMDLPCIIGIDRAGLVGADGETHHGVFDISFLSSVPNLIIMVPSHHQEAMEMINTAYQLKNHPYILRYSKNSIQKEEFTTNTIQIGTWEYCQYNKNHKISVITYGDNVNLVKELAQDSFLDINIINARFIKPMDYSILDAIKNTHIIVFQTDILEGSLGSQICLYYANHHANVNIDVMGIEDKYTPQGTVNELLDLEHLTMPYLLNKIKEILNEEGKN